MDVKNCIKFKYVIFLLLIISNFFIAQVENIRENEWIKNWKLFGPIQLGKSSDESTHLPGFEINIQSAFVKGNNFQEEIKRIEQSRASHANWIEYTATDSIINLDEAISDEPNMAVYAYTEIHSETEKIYTFSLGSNDGCRLWINGLEVWDYTGARGTTSDDDLFPVLLKKGKNKILLKVEERGNNWSFCARILPFNFETYIQTDGLLKIVNTDNDQVELRFSLSDQAVRNLFKSIKLEVYSNDKDSSLIWFSDWNKEKRMVLEINIQKYNSYVLKIKAERYNNIKWEKNIEFKSGKRVDYKLFCDNKTDYRIIVGENASESEQWAAKELQKSLFEISGAHFEIKSDSSEMLRNEIIIGYNKHSQNLLHDNFNQPDSLDESFYYKNIKSNILLIGGKQRGTMYSVFSFLENEFGIRWYTPDVTLIPERNEYTFNYFNHSEKPSIQVRNDFYYEAFNPMWAAHNKINGAMGYRKQPGEIEAYWGVHTFYRFMPPSEFFEDHPEYYSLIDGKRIHENAQLCLSNPDVLDIVTERLKVAINKNPNNLIYSVSQNDWDNPCQCKNCQNIVDAYAGQSGILIWFVNQIADRIKNDYPNKYIGTLAYQYTRKPPLNIIPNENVVIRLCSIECCFSHDFASCHKNKDFLTDLKGWSAISPHLYIWDYVVGFGHFILPFPNFNVLQPNIKTFRDNKTIGIMEQAVYQTRGGEFAELRAYLISKLLWNAECNVDDVIDDFMYGYYGKSGIYIRKYFDLLHAQVKPHTHIGIWLKPDDIIFTNDFINKADKLFNKAEIVAEDIEIKNRVELARLPLIYLKCNKNPIISKYDGTYDDFKRIVKRENITHFSEFGPPVIDAFHEKIKNAK